MKYSILLLFLFTALNTTFSQGIQFEPEGISWDDVVQKAQKVAKNIFVYAYAVPCQNCQHMNDSIYADSGVAGVFNEHYLNVKLDIDDPTYEQFVGAYQVYTYPTYMFFSKDGILLHATTGTKTAAEMARIGEESLDPDYQYYTLMDRFGMGDRDAEMMLRLAWMAESNGYTALVSQVSDAFLETQTDWLQTETMKVLFAGLIDIEQPSFHFMLDHQAAFREVIGAAKVDEKVDDIILDGLMLGAWDYAKNFVSLDKARDFAQKALPKAHSEKGFALFELRYLGFEQNMDELIPAAIQYLEKYPSNNPTLLNNLAIKFHLAANDKALLEKALGWALHAAELRKDYSYRETTTALYFKLGDFPNARIEAQKALDIAKEYDIDPEQILALLEKMK